MSLDLLLDPTVTSSRFFRFTRTSACNVSCANLKTAFIIDIIFILLTPFISLPATHEQHLISRFTAPYFGEVSEGSSNHEAFLWELFGPFRYLPGTVWIILLVTVLAWIGWFPFLLVDTDWMGCEVYGEKPNEGMNYGIGVRSFSLGLMLNSVILGITSVLREKLCRKWGAGFTWGLSNILTCLCFVAMFAIIAIKMNMNTDGHLPPDGVVIAALVVFALLDIPLDWGYSVFLIPDHPLFGIAPRVFGSVCFVHLHSPNLDKLSPRSVKCIFLGYSRAQKGYRCYDPQSHRSFTFVDVTFFGSTPFYSPQSSQAISPTLVPLPVLTLSIPPRIQNHLPALQVYSCRNRSTTTSLTASPGLPPTATPGNPSATSANDLPITLHKDYFETFSLVARLNSVRVLFSLALNLNWAIYQMDIKNAFLYGDLNETVYMEQPPGYVARGEKQRMVCKLKKAIYGLKQSPKAWFDKFSRIIGEFGFSRCQVDHSVFVQTTRSGMVVLAVYVDDILITDSDIVGIEEAKTYLRKHFITKDLGRPRYFLGIEIPHNKHGVSLSQRKYACDLLQEAGLLGTKPVDTPMDSNLDFWNDDGNYLEDKTKYRRLVGKLIYLIVTRPDISFAVGLVIIQATWTKDDRKSTSRYCTYVGGNHVTWRSKKQTIIVRLSAEAEYRAIAHTSSEILWLKNLLKELVHFWLHLITASNPIFHERTKHIEVDCHFVRQAVMSQKVCTPFTPSSEQRADIFTKALRSKQFDVLSNKLGMIDIFAPA
ncbi:UNVERIFIED_CONTAM: Sucrose transport protein SUC4 [Sesamum radiatum]|uniref:Sucrose transport protein SUC4 n=2 Tax=Sesamum TaxID=4181 RepID=A0AAW2SI90_SESRA